MNEVRVLWPGKPVAGMRDFQAAGRAMQWEWLLSGVEGHWTVLVVWREEPRRVSHGAEKVAPRSPSSWSEGELRDQQQKI